MNSRVLLHSTHEVLPGTGVALSGAASMVPVMTSVEDTVDVMVNTGLPVGGNDSSPERPLAPGLGRGVGS